MSYPGYSSILTITMGVPDRVVVVVVFDAAFVVVVVVVVVDCSCLQIKSLFVPHLSSRCH